MNEQEVINLVIAHRAALMTMEHQEKIIKKLIECVEELRSGQDFYMINDECLGELNNCLNDPMIKEYMESENE